MDYHHWRETHGTRFLCACRSLSTTGRILDRTARFSSLSISVTLLRRINNGANEQAEQQTQVTGFATRQLIYLGIIICLTQKWIKIVEVSVELKRDGEG